MSYCFFDKDINQSSPYSKKEIHNYLDKLYTLFLVFRDSGRDGWIKRIYKTEMKFRTVLGSRAAEKEKLPTSRSMQLFGVVFSTFYGQKKN